MRINKFKLYDSQDGGYFAFAPCIYTLNRKRLSVGLELAGRRFFYLYLEWK